MDHVNWWLLGLAVVLGLLLTFALTIRRVKREVPVSPSTEAAAVSDAAKSKTEKSESESETKEDSGGG